jgi:hypothetical protein
MTVFYFSAQKRMCQAMFKSTNPASGNYPSNWTTALTNSQSKVLLIEDDVEYWSEDGANVKVVNSGEGKVSVSFSNMKFTEWTMDTTKTKQTRTVSGNFGTK